jgi:IS1 family transposase
MNKKSIASRTQILRCLVEGSSIRSTVRMTGASKNTIVRLLAEIGEACEVYQYKNLIMLPCEIIQVDENWSFVYSKQKNITRLKAIKVPGEAGDIWTWTAICSKTKIVPSWYVGRRDAGAAKMFIEDLAPRLANRVQLTSDGLQVYLKAVAGAFGNKIDYAMLVKLYGPDPEEEKRYSPLDCTGAITTVICGDPDSKHVSTSHVERNNLTMRMGMRRFTRLTNGFSKKVDNHIHAIALHFMYYNFCRVHSSIKTTPAIAASVAAKIWSLEDVVRMSDDYWKEQKSK